MPQSASVRVWSSLPRVLGDRGAHCLAGPRKVPEQGGLSGGGFCTIYCPRENQKHFFLQVQVTSRKFRWLILYPTHPQGSPHPVQAPGPHFISHLRLNTCLESSQCRGTTTVTARAGFVLGAASYGGCCHGKSPCLTKLKSPTWSIEASPCAFSSPAMHPQSWGQIKTEAKRLQRG